MNCAYCGREADPTDEHVLPQWLRGELPEHSVVSPARGRHLFGGELVVNDVCVSCNGGPLSRLDEFAKGYFVKGLDSTDSLSAEDSQRMARWAAKVCYNSQRAAMKLGSAGAEPEMPVELREWILRGGPWPRSVRMTMCRFPESHRDTDETGTFGPNKMPLPRRYLKLRRALFFMAWDPPGQPGASEAIAASDRAQLPGVDMNSAGDPIGIPMIADANMPLRGVWNNRELLEKMGKKFSAEQSEE